MMNTTFISKITHWILRFIQAQLLVSLVSLPLLASWGLPVSALSPVGNLIFLPFFMVFLFISSLLFFTELLYIPNGLFITLLDKISTFWLALMPENNHTPLIGFVKPNLFFLLCIPSATFFILSCKKIKTITTSILSLTALLALSIVYLKIIQAPKDFIKQLPCNKGNVTLLYNKGKTIVIDPGVLGARISASSWITYTLIPEMIKACGKTHIDHLILMSPGTLLFEAIETLCKSLHVRHIYLVYWNGQLNKSALRNFYFMKKAAIQSKTIIHRIGNIKEIISISSQTTITLSPFTEKIKYHKATFPALCVTCKIDNKTLNIYSAKYKNPKNRRKIK